jgi:deazaflavin-dependent oxidoreductase (nitroreductase family)
MAARTWSDEELRAAVAVSSCLTAVLRELGLRPAGGNHASVRRHIERLGLDTSHFRRRPPPRRPGRPLGDLLVRGSQVRTTTLKERLYAAGIKRRRCELCGQGEQWRGRRMALVLDHINGEHDDNRLENLRIVCPNCNATLDTHCGRQTRRRPAERRCDLCGAVFAPRRTHQRFCSQGCAGRGEVPPAARPGARRVVRPPYEALVAQVAAEGWRATGRRYGVSDNAVRKWVRAHEREQGGSHRAPGGASARSAPPGSVAPMTETDDDNLFGDEHVRVYRETGGRRGYHWRGAEILLLNTTGRRSGEPRTMPLIMRADGDGRWVIVASKGGHPDHPAWYKNLQADPEVTIEVRDEEIPVRARDAEGEERERLWSMMTEVWPAYDDYQAKTDRQIPVVVLERR